MLKNKYYIKIIVDSHSGTVSRLLSLFAKRSISIDSINSGDELGTEFVRIVFGVQCQYNQLEMITHQIEKLIDTVSVTLYDEGAEEVETWIVKFQLTSSEQGKIIEKIQKKNIEIIKQNSEEITLCKTGTQQEINNALSILKPHTATEMIKTGTTYFK